MVLALRLPLCDRAGSPDAGRVGERVGPLLPQGAATRKGAKLTGRSRVPTLGSVDRSPNYNRLGVAILIVLAGLAAQWMVAPRDGGQMWGPFEVIGLLAAAAYLGWPHLRAWATQSWDDQQR